MDLQKQRQMEVEEVLAKKGNGGKIEIQAMLIR